MRHAKRDGRSVAVLRAVDYGTSCVVEAQVFPGAGDSAVAAGPYSFADPARATTFVTEAVESLIALGCDIFAE